MRLVRSQQQESGFLEALVETLTGTTENMGRGQAYVWWTAPRPWSQPKGDGSRWQDYV